jgi:hypothetical protein
VGVVPRSLRRRGGAEHHLGGALTGGIRKGELVVVKLCISRYPW